MEKNSYFMAKLGLENKKKLHPQRDCGFYAKYIFFFLFLIQSLIILGLVLFMVYGNNHDAMERHLKGMNIWMQECRDKATGLTKEKANLTSLLNASRSESRQINLQLSKANGTFRTCSADKLKYQMQLRQAEATIQNTRVCYDILSYFNATYPDKVSTLEMQLKLKTAEADLERKALTQEKERLQAQVKSVQEQELACQQKVVQLQTQVRKAGELEAQVMSELQSASQSMKSAVEAALPSQPIWICHTNEVQTLQTTCLNLSKQLDVLVVTLRQRLEDRINVVVMENSQLQKEKLACSQEREGLRSKLKAQEQRLVMEKEALQLTCSTEKSAIYAEQDKLFKEKDSLRQELDRIKQKCWTLQELPIVGGAELNAEAEQTETMPEQVPPLPNPGMRMPGASSGTNPIANFPGNLGSLSPVGAPNNFNPHFSRTGGVPAVPSSLSAQGLLGNLPAPRNLAPVGHIGSHRTQSRSGYDKLEDSRKPAGAGVISSYKPLVKPTGQPSG